MTSQNHALLWLTRKIHFMVMFERWDVFVIITVSCGWAITVTIVLCNNSRAIFIRTDVLIVPEVAILIIFFFVSVAYIYIYFVFCYKLSVESLDFAHDTNYSTFSDVGFCSIY